MENIEEVEKKIGYTFKNKELLRTALTHTSYAYENKTASYERLEFLGDSILEFVSSKFLYKHFPNIAEGDMTKIRSYAVCETSLYTIAQKHNFVENLYLGKSEMCSNNSRKAILADVIEAIIAAIYLDGGLDASEKFILDNITEKMEYASKNVGVKDYKTVLQETLQTHGTVIIKYNIIDEKGPDHNKTFVAEVVVDGKKMAQGTGSSKKLAEMDAAKKTLEML